MISFLYRIDQNFVIKVADFGLSVNVDITKGYYRQEMKNDVKLPIKWLAPECINDGLFSEKSDVVSYVCKFPQLSCYLHTSQNFSSYHSYMIGFCCTEPIFSGHMASHAGRSSMEERPLILE